MEFSPLGVIGAPHAGAWVETQAALDYQKAEAVAPHAGAWVETYRKYSDRLSFYPSRPMRARGLKLYYDGAIISIQGRAPCGRVG